MKSLFEPSSMAACLRLRLLRAEPAFYQEGRILEGTRERESSSMDRDHATLRLYYHVRATLRD